jgi:hypothetical protein
VLRAADAGARRRRGECRAPVDGFRLKPEATGAESETASTRWRSADTKFQESFKYEGVEPRSRTVREVPAIEPNELNDLNLADWLGGRDSNPDNVVQSHVSYR